MAKRKQPFPKAAHGCVQEGRQIVAGVKAETVRIQRSRQMTPEEKASTCFEMVLKLDRLKELFSEMEQMVREDIEIQRTADQGVSTPVSLPPW
jgi:hypothetical protein